MASCKQVHIQVMQNDTIVHDEKYPGGNSTHRKHIRTVMQKVDAEQWTNVQINVQTVGAKGWGRYRYQAGGREAVKITNEKPTK